jgi:hypothetical protein
VSHTWTNHEQALAACFSEEDTSIDAQFHTKPSPTLWGIKVEIDSELCIPGGSPLVVMQQPVIWTERPGLTRGILKPRRYRPPHLRSLSPSCKILPLVPGCSQDNVTLPWATAMAVARVLALAFLGCVPGINTQ